MQKILILLFSAVLLLNSCDLVFHHSIKGNGDIKRISRDISRADRIKVSGGIDVVIRKGEPGIEVEADDNLLRYIETRVHDGWLEVRTKKDYQLRSENSITVYVTTEELHALKVAGSSNVTSDDDWAMNGTFKLDVSGSGDVSLNLNTANIDADISGSGNIDLAGNAEKLNLDIAGSGSFKGYGLKCETVDLDVAGSGEAEVYADERLKVSIAGSGDVKYHGNPTVSRSVAGSGNIQKTD